MATKTQKEQETPAQAEHALEVNHLDGCPVDAERIETYETKGPRGWVVITRCMDCGAHKAAKPTEEPRLVDQEARR